MNKYRVLFFYFFIFLFYINSYQLVCQTYNAQPYNTGEFVKWRITYGLLNAGFATISLKEKSLNNKTYHHGIGRGWTTGIVRFFFKIEDRYESIFDKYSQKPKKFIRDINEGGYKKHRELEFQDDNSIVRVHDLIKNSVSNHQISSDVLDLISVYYSLRQTDIDSLIVGKEIYKKIFFDFDTFYFKIQVLAREFIKTKFGWVYCFKIRPLVQSGEIFKEKESVTMWITADKNLLPIRIKAELVVGAIKADIFEFTNLAHEIKFLHREQVK